VSKIDLHCVVCCTPDLNILVGFSSQSVTNKWRIWS